jgi:NhaA family Na+:H+ antiporter
VEYLNFFASDILLTVFFFVIGLELVEELKNGDLRDLKRASLPALAAVGGVLVPSLLYISIVQISGISSENLHGWAIPTATDVAFSLMILSLFKNKLRPGVKLFLMVLAVVDDILGIVIIALVYSTSIEPLGILLVLILSTSWAVIIRQLENIKSRSILLFLKILLLFLAGSIWLAIYKSGIHPTIAGVILGLITPAVHNEKASIASTLIDFLAPFSAKVIVPVFAIVSIIVSAKEIFTDTSITTGQNAQSLAYNADLFVSSYDLFIVAFSVAFSLVVGKPIGILIFAWIGSHLTPLKLFHGLKVRNLVGVSLLGGIGFTVSFLIASLSFSNELLIAFARLGVLAGSFISAIIGYSFIHFSIKKMHR